MSDILHDVSWVIPYRNEVLTKIFELFTWLGYPVFIMVFLALGYWLWDKKTFTRISVLVILSTLLNAYLKDLWQNPRPDIAMALDPGVGKSYGMPSGHAQIAFVLWFGLAYEIKQRWAWILAAVIVAGVCFSRIYLGVHDLEDILAGSAIGLGTLGVYKSLCSNNNALFSDAALWKILIGLGLLTVILHVTWPNDAITLPALALSGFLFGWLLGSRLDAQFIGGSLANKTWAIPAIIIIGAAGFVALFSVIKPIMASIDPAYANYVQTMVMGFYITLMAPCLFKLTKVTQ